MSRRLRISVGQCSDKGRKPTNQDFHGICIPDDAQLSAKGIAIAVADGISSSELSHIASESAVKGFLEDYYCTSAAWSVKTSAQRVLNATNSWLHAQTQQSPYRYDKDKGYVCTFSALVIKSATAHLFHVGDTRIYRVEGQALEQLTQDHRVVITQNQSYLSRALGANAQLEIDYRALPITQGDLFVLASDGVYEHADPRFIVETIQNCKDDLDGAAQAIVAEALARGSPDNLTIQILRVEELPLPSGGELHQQVSELPPAPLLEARMTFEGYKILREVHGSSRSHIYLAEDLETQTRVILKTPSVDLQGDPAYLERFMMEEWVARRINNAHVLKPCPPTRKRNYLYVVTEFIEGRTLSQWMIDHPKPDLETVRGIVEQIAKGLRAFHRVEMLHQDLRPENIMIDAAGTVKIIDFGSVRVAGVVEGGRAHEANQILGTAQYTAPEYFLGEGGSPRSDLFSLAVITYQMLTGRLPYGAEVAKSSTRKAQSKLKYRSALAEDRPIPSWIDGVLKKALDPNPYKRHDALSEFLQDLRQPSQQFLKTQRPPLLERNPLLFWQALSFALTLVILVLLAGRAVTH